MKTKSIKAWHGPSVLVNDYFPNSNVIIFPADSDSYERMVEQASSAMYKHARRFDSYERLTWKTTFEIVREAYRQDARSALRAIGITPRTGRGGKGRK